MTAERHRHDTAIVWLRRDLRLTDNIALYEACARSSRICVAFVITPDVAARDRIGSPLAFAMFDALGALRSHLKNLGSDLALLQGEPAAEVALLAERIGARAVFYNEEYDPDAMRRDDKFAGELRSRGINVFAHTDHVYFGAGEVRTDDGSPYRMFTPYKRRWLEQRAVSPRLPVPSEHALPNKLISRAALGQTLPSVAPDSFGFVSSKYYPRASERIASELLSGFLREDGPVAQYGVQRNFPAEHSTSFLSPQLRVGTIGIRTCVEHAFALRSTCENSTASNVEVWISELIWRDFYHMILRQFPHVRRGPFLPKASRISWRAAEDEFEAWCAGQTGFPLVDAGMRQLNRYGWMHNRLRMATASFLTKDLLIDWREGERYFEQCLADADLAQNNGGWQWAASTGTDAVPYFRVFNPVLQSKRFDPEGTFIRRMVPELSRVPNQYIHEPWLMPPALQASIDTVIGKCYPAPIVDHAIARQRALSAYKTANLNR